MRYVVHRTCRVPLLGGPALAVAGLDGTSLAVVGQPEGAPVALMAKPDAVTSYRVCVIAPAAAIDGDGVDMTVIDDAWVTAAFVRPTLAGHDVELAVPHAHAGVYVAEADMPLAGVWELHVSAQSGGDTYRMSRRVYLKP